MSATATRLVRFAVSLAILTTLGWMLTVRAASPARRGMPLPTDWSHHHLFFSQPGTPEAVARVQRDVRFQQQWMRRNQPLELKHAAVSPQLRTSPQVAEALGSRVPRRRAMQSRTMGRDWSQDVGTVTGGPPVPNLGLAGVYPAKFSIDGTAANCGSAPSPDFVVFPTGFTGSSSQANIVAYDNIYSGCGGTVPSVYWAYNITDVSLGNVQILTSPTFSLDGSQVAFVADNPTSTASWLVILRWAASTTQSVGAPGTANLVSNAAYVGCTAPCMTTIELRTGVSHTTTEDTTSSVFYDYANDSAWVGDDQGWLHKFSGVFNGTPAEVITNFPVQVRGAAFVLSSPVYDHSSQNVFVGDSDGFLSRVDGTSGTVVSSGQLDHGAGLVAGPVVDSTKGAVYVSASSDGTTTGSCTPDACAALYQLPTSFTAGSTGTEVTVGKSTDGSSTPNPMYNGEFDNAYLTSSGTGNFYVCGNTGANPILYQVPITAGVPGSGIAVATLATNASTPACSPVTDVSVPNATVGSAATEHIFASVQNNSSTSTCAGGGCVQGLINTPWQASTAFPVGQEILVTSPFDLTVRYINIVISNPTSGQTGATQPNWPDTNGVKRVDGAITWLNQGNPDLSAAAWLPSTSYSSNARIIDSHGNYEIETTAGTSGVGPPAWASTPGATTPDGAGLVWTNAGPPPSSAIAAAGGTGAIIIDNTITTGPTSGTSQVYFSTLNNQTCGTSGSGSCAVQASQAALQ